MFCVCVCFSAQLHESLLRVPLETRPGDAGGQCLTEVAALSPGTLFLYVQ